jgi:hypothetical protein
VKVMLFQNPDTVESRIWALLNEKLERIRQSINAVTEEPEDLHQLVLGIARPGVLDTVFSDASFVPRAKLDEWFDHHTGQMGGEDAVRVVQDLLGHAQHFDFGQVSDRIPKLDLPDLAPFFRLALRQNRRQLTETGGLMAFKTPEPWQRSVGVRPRYDDVHFERNSGSRVKGTILGVGNRLFDSVLEQACQTPDTYAAVSDQGGQNLLLVFRCYDRVTGNPSQPKTVICGVLWEAESIRIIKDWQILRVLNELAPTLRPSTDAEPHTQVAPPGKAEILTRAASLVRDAFRSLDLPFLQPELELLGIVAGVQATPQLSRSSISVSPL